MAKTNSRHTKHLLHAARFARQIISLEGLTARQISVILELRLVKVAVFGKAIFMLPNLRRQGERRCLNYYC